MLLTSRIRRYDVNIVIADKYYPSTKMCNCNKCGYVKEMKLKDRVYKCDCCGLTIDRDLNAAINLANYK